MNLQNGRLSTASSSGAWRSGETTPDHFPAGLRVLVVDDDPTCLMILEKMLRTCLYQVTKCNRAEIALSLLRENKNGYDVVISDVHMPDMDGFKLLEHIGLEMDLPVIMMSADDGKSVVMKGVTHGACDYLIKPVRIEALKNIWQHVVRKKKNEGKDVEQSGRVDEGDRQQKPGEEPDYSSSANEGTWKNSKKRKDEDAEDRDEDEDAEDRDDTSTLKKSRVVWSVELHQQFVGAVNQLGIDKAVPKKILELMNVPGLTRENVASHLQKYRLYLRRLSGVSPHQSNFSNSFISSQEASFGAISSLNGIDLQSLAAAGQLPAQSLATLQAAGLGMSTPKSGMPMPVVDQRNLFSIENGNSKLRFAEGQPHHSNGKPMNLLHGIPTTMEAKQLANLHQSTQSLGAVNMHVNPHGVQNNSPYMIGQQQPREQIMSESTVTHVPRLPSSTGQPMVSNGVVPGFIGRNGVSDGGRGSGYNIVPQTSSMLNFPLNNTPGNSYTVGSMQGMSSLTPRGTFPEAVNSEIKRTGGFVPSYDMFNEIHQPKSNDWNVQNVGLTFNDSHHPNSVHGSLDSGLVRRGFSSNQRNAQHQNSSNVGRPVFPVGASADHGRMQNAGPHLGNNLIVNNTVRVKSERLSDASQNGFFHDQYAQDDLMSAYLKQQQGGVGPTENEFEFEFDGYSLDNIPV